jgi:hypothetical protein
MLSTENWVRVPVFQPLPIQFVPAFRGLMPIVVLGVQVPAGGRDRLMAEVVAHVTQINLLVHHVGACCVPQPMGRGLSQTPYSVFAGFALQR